MTHTILLAEDEPVQQQMMTALLERKLGYRVQRAPNGKEAVAALRGRPAGYFSAALLDIQMPEMDGFEALRSLRRLAPDLPVIMLTSQDDTETAVRAIRNGAVDFLTKPVNPAKLQVALANAIRLRDMASELARLRRDKEGSLSFADLIGHDGDLCEAVAIGRKAALADVPIFIRGETGVGKELFARAIHGESRRAGQPFIAINCGAIPENLVESVLFGHEKGAFTSATSRSIGKFREAEGGTVFLDEVGDLPLETQVKLLRVLQQREVEPVGAGRPLKVDVRVLSATHRDIAAAVRQGRFREDLYFRLNVLPVTVPPLRERPHDILPLAAAFLARFAMADSLPPKALDESAQAYLARHSWPGNVRELENLMRRALVLGEGEKISATLLESLQQDHLPHFAEKAAEGAENGQAAAVDSSVLSLALQHPDGRFKTVEEIEAAAMRALLDHQAGNITQASQTLGMAKSTFYRKMKQYRIS